MGGDADALVEHTYTAEGNDEEYTINIEKCTQTNVSTGYVRKIRKMRKKVPFHIKKCFKKNSGRELRILATESHWS